MQVIGRKIELESLKSALSIHRNILIEGPVGVGKTYLVQSFLNKNKKGFIRIDGDSRYSEQKLTGWFDPPLVLKKGYTKDSFIEGPLVQAMSKGQVLFINELNRMPEAVQNILLPAMDEGQITLPKIGGIKAKKGFCIIATQNPREFTATHALSEALMDRFEMIHLNYQSLEEELEIVSLWLGKKVEKAVIKKMVEVIRATRQHASLKRGASIRAAIAWGELLEAGLDLKKSAFMALPGRLEPISIEEPVLDIIESLLEGKRSEKKN